jgi:uncharacterized protein (TIGR00730 family)
MRLRAAAVFCGSASGKSPLYQQSAMAMGRLLAREKITLVYGGGKNGLMGMTADAALAEQGKVIGVMPVLFEKYEVAHKSLTRLEMVQNMHERKQRMAELSDAFIILPGGAGTMDEFFEQWTWMHIGVHKKPCAILNVNGYYDRLLGFIRHDMVRSGFLLPGYLDGLIVSKTPADLLKQLRAYKPLPSKRHMAEKVKSGRRAAV